MLIALLICIPVFGMLYKFDEIGIDKWFYVFFAVFLAIFPIRLLPKNRKFTTFQFGGVSYIDRPIVFSIIFSLFIFFYLLCILEIIS